MSDLVLCLIRLQVYVQAYIPMFHSHCLPRAPACLLFSQSYGTVHVWLARLAKYWYDLLVGCLWKHQYYTQNPVLLSQSLLFILLYFLTNWARRDGLYIYICCFAYKLEIILFPYMGSQIMFALLVSEQQSPSLDEACPNHWKIITFADSLLRSDQSKFPKRKLYF